MATAVISDLHLGAHGRGDVLRRPAFRRRLVEALAGVDRLVILGDVLELREASLKDALDMAQPFFDDVGEALGHGRLVIVPGNHDHQLAAPLLARVAATGRPLGFEERMAPAPGDPLAAVAARIGPASLELVYPGLWLRPDVYATHGHYLDLHNSVPTLEALALALSARLGGGRPGPGATPADYESELRRVYRLIGNFGHTTEGARGAAGADLSIRAWQSLAGSDSTSVATRVVAGVLFPGAVSALNRAGLGPFRADLSGRALREAGLAAIRAVVEALAIDAQHVIFGHTHRSGPWPGGGVGPDDDLAGWVMPGRPRLTNTGSWVYQPAFLTPTPGESPYWPGTLTLIEATGPPRLRRLLGDVGHDQLR